MQSGRVVVHPSAFNQSDFKGVVMAKYMLVSGIKVSIGQQSEKFGRLSAIGLAFRLSGITYVVCECECGSVAIAVLSDIRRGNTKSCGCLLRETNKINKTKHGGYRGDKESPEMSTWRSMMRRCYEFTKDNFGSYGGRGISVCEQWRGDNGFANFLEDMGSKPSLGHTLDRIDNEGNYCPENCRWATQKQQQNNKRSNTFLVHDGKRMTLKQWSEAIGIGSSTILERMKSGLSVSDALTKPLPKGTPKCS
jgi:hypothetical protein